jgi:Tol biopolymer transport system component
MKYYLPIIIIFSFLLNGCPSENSNQPTKDSDFSGYIYYSGDNFASRKGVLFRLNLKNMTEENLMSNAYSPDITNDGNIVAMDYTPKARIIITNHDGSNRTPILAVQDYPAPIHRNFMYNPKISFDQELIAYYGEYDSYIINRNSGELVLSASEFDKEMTFSNPCWAPDGSIYLEGRKNNIRGIYKIDSEFRSIERIDPNLSNVKMPIISPDGLSLACVSDGKLWIMNPDGSEAFQINTEINKIAFPVWSPDSESIAFTDSGNIYLLNITTLKMVKISDIYAGASYQIAWGN